MSAKTLLVLTLAWVMLAVPIADRARSMGDPVCLHDRCPAGVEVSR
jgi:hypothetical protein